MKQKLSSEKNIAAIVMGATLMGFSPSIHFNDVNGQTRVTVQMMNTTYAYETGNYKAPRLDGYKFSKKFNIDWSEDGRIDTTITTYVNNNGDVIAKAYKKGTIKIWSWGLNTANDDNSNISKNYTIADTDDDGKFDTRYKVPEDMPLPSWVEQ